ncbi:MAG TPA: oxidoreductase [Accumulibacter sp.]|uniref:Acrylyl-CoA reductase AcuI n=2 Tax=Candidatus Accumulibacter TaxID=327159 RepID=A0A080M446_9PROT|nr:MULTISPECIES: oxidoreductase [Candidatus Accumulibacter]KFB75250.1 MAG: Acrylyl-CoA reductase AcuI [Candidatus Accumulibacter cognatus]MBL8402645.1 oxidoreductase [Accumulibacter sp.]MBN8519304.1 oxidoreductase [Accumulibacter sp.]MBO3709364.1 oxidoreductase [Accumulibacter sp.]MCC2868343.1 oxidoreductase [Candidatus Accumulibacter phosphatis]
MSPFKAYLVEEHEGLTRAGWVTMDESQLDPGEITIKVAYSSVNYKDALAATGAGRIIRRYPCVGGIDLSGTVTRSSDPRFRTGDAVIATSFDIGVAHHGGYAEYARVPADWVVPLPSELSLHAAMALGTAGFTAALGIVRMEENGLDPSKGPLIVTGATGGVGSLAVDMLAARGYQVTALTGKEEQTDYLKGLGAKAVMFRSALDLTRIRPLDKALWAGAVDNLGGEVLAWIISTMKQGGTIASIGLAASHSLNTTVMPFILRGACLLGIDSGYIGEPYRNGVWQRLAGDLRPQHLQEMVRTIRFDDLPGVFDDYLKGRVRGRVVVEIAGA